MLTHLSFQDEVDAGQLPVAARDSLTRGGSVTCKYKYITIDTSKHNQNIEWKRFCIISVHEQYLNSALVGS
jgi:hypothetical protein